MSKYLFRANYTQKGLSGLIKEGGTGRRQALTQTVESLGGSLDCLYYAFGEYDAVGVADFPDQESATAFSLNVSAAGAIDVELTVLVSPEQIDAAVEKHISYRLPGE